MINITNEHIFITISDVLQTYILLLGRSNYSSIMALLIQTRKEMREKPEICWTRQDFACKNEKNKTPPYYFENSNKKALMFS